MTPRPHMCGDQVATTIDVKYRPGDERCLLGGTPNPMPELAPLLKRLRLSGILDSLETRNREAVANKIPYTDFLASSSPTRSPDASTRSST